MQAGDRADAANLVQIVTGDGVDRERWTQQAQAGRTGDPGMDPRQRQFGPRLAGQPSVRPGYSRGVEQSGARGRRLPGVGQGMLAGEREQRFAPRAGAARRRVGNDQRRRPRLASSLLLFHSSHVVPSPFFLFRFSSFIPILLTAFSSFPPPLSLFHHSSQTTPFF
ncbi:MAG: hypothetical protein J0M01_18575 [Dechloromonas sp.]|nr:hypothetical protein [Dechloromonas sp.]